MQETSERFYLAALTYCLGRAGAIEAVREATCPRAAFASVSRPRVDPRELERQCAAAGIEVLTRDDPDYPALLRVIPDAPAVLYARGRPGALLRPTVAVVGARRCTHGGAEVAGHLAGALAERGLCVVSGMAHGIDAAAHRAAVDRGITVAVVGSGLARPYPTANQRLAERIVATGGLLLSEYPPWQGARRHHFPERNRLISGVALGVLVVEAGEHSGSLITARMAAEQGREVCAVPGLIGNPVSRGCHRLIREGAALVTSADDVLEALGLPLEVGAPERPGPEDAVLAGVLTRVEASVTTLDEIVAATRLAAEVASAALVELELGGFVRQVPGGYIRRPLP